MWSKRRGKIRGNACLSAAVTLYGLSLAAWTTSEERVRDMRWLILVLTCVATADAVEAVCFPGYEKLGCFSMDAPWQTLSRPLPTPEPPGHIRTRIYAYSRDFSVGIVVKLWPSIFIDMIPMRTKKSVFVIHGFRTDGHVRWLRDMKNALLNIDDVNVFIVDWGKGAVEFNYLQVASNTRVVAAECVRFLRFLMVHFDVKPSDIHIIGHSLGSHIGAYVGKEIRGIRRLTALDPAQPGFEDYEEAVRLCKTDADFVEVMHTDGKFFIPYGGLGMIKSYGHVDFYMNGGSTQPGCLTPRFLPNTSNFCTSGNYLLDELFENGACSHFRAFQYYTEVLNNKQCTFWGHKRTGDKSVLSVLTAHYFNFDIVQSNCDIDSCLPLSYNITDYPARGTFNINTRSASPYCIPDPVVDAVMEREYEKYKSKQRNKFR